MPKTEGEIVKAIREATKIIDWQQVVRNGGPPCFHVEDGKFCLRAERWDGHGRVCKFHEFTTLEMLIGIIAQHTPARKRTWGDAELDRLWAQMRDIELGMDDMDLIDCDNSQKMKAWTEANAQFKQRSLALERRTK